MMSYLLIAALALSLGVLAYRHYRLRAALRDVAEQLEAARAPQAPAQLLYPTDSPELQALLASINQALHDLQQVRAENRRNELSMRQMFSHISHDLKTPLTVILGYLETLAQQPNLSAEQRAELQQQVHRKGQELVRLLNNFFELAMLEAGDREVPLAPVLLNEVCAQKLLSYYEFLEQNAIRAEIDIPEQPLYALANTDALGRVLDNLIANALRHGADGGMLGFRLRADGQHVVCEVIDRGQGIAEQHGDRVFQRLATLDEARSGSSGLGLSISKHLTELMHGTLSYRSQPNVETIFTVRLPRYEADRLVGVRNA
jgi:signal transduction histidine kinase